MMHHLFIESWWILELGGVARGGATWVRGGGSAEGVVESSEATPTWAHDDPPAGHELDVVVDAERLQQLSRTEEQEQEQVYNPS